MNSMNAYRICWICGNRFLVATQYILICGFPEYFCSLECLDNRVDAIRAQHEEIMHPKSWWRKLRRFHE